MGIKIVRGQLCQWNVHKSVGSDGIHLRILKNLVDVIVELQSIIYQRYWEQGEVSAGWKIATVVPIYKRGVVDVIQQCALTAKRASSIVE